MWATASSMRGGGSRESCKPCATHATTGATWSAKGSPNNDHDSEPVMNESKPVSRLVQPVILLAAALTFFLALIAVGGVLVSSRSVNHITDELQPAATANAD